MRRRYRGPLFALVVTAFLLLLVETGSRFLLFTRTPDEMVFDDEIIYTYAPKASVAQMTLNDIGCIGDDLRDPGTADIPTLLLLGGSTTFSGFYVSEVKDSVSDAHAGQPLKVVSCGKPRYTSHTNRVNLEENLLRYRPAVIVLYMGINDNIYNSFPWVTNVPDVGYFNWRSKSESIFWRLLKYHLFEKRIFSTPDFAGQSLRSARIFEANVQGIIDLSRQHGAKVVLSTFAVAYPTDDVQLLQTIRAQEGVMRHFWGTLDSTVLGVATHNRLMLSLAKENGLPLVEVDRLIPRDGAHFIDLCHLTDPSYRLLAKEIAAAIVEGELLQKSHPG